MATNRKAVALPNLSQVLLSGAPYLDRKAHSLPNLSLVQASGAPYLDKQAQALPNVSRVLQSAAAFKSFPARFFGEAGPDASVPIFGGITGAAAASAHSATLYWNAGTDDRTTQGNLFYDVSWATHSGQVFVLKRSFRGSEVMPIGWEHLEPPIPCVCTIDELDPETAYWFMVRCRDEYNNRETNEVEYSCTTPENTASKPIISNVLPAVGTTITVDQPFSFDVTDDSGRFRRILVAVRFNNTGEEELIHDGDGFVGFYSALSSRSTLGLGFHYTVRRSGGWLGSPTFKVYAFDRTGNEA